MVNLSLDHHDQRLESACHRFRKILREYQATQDRLSRLVYARDGQWAQSEKRFRRAIALESNNSGFYDDFSTWLLLPLGQIDEAVRQMRLATKADPLSPFIQQRLAVMLLCAGRYDEAASHCSGKRLLE